jgi:hypothetical protein
VQVYNPAATEGVGRNATAAPSGGLSMFVSAPGPGIVAERPVYAVTPAVNDGHDAVGQDTTVNCSEFAAAFGGTSAASYLTVANPSSSSVDVTIELYTGAARPLSIFKTVPANERLTVDLGSYTTSTTFGVDITSSGGSFIAELPIYAAWSNPSAAEGAAVLLGSSC